MLKLRSTNQKIDTVFVTALFTLFSITAFVLVILCVKQYQITADTMNQNYDNRSAASYIQEKAHQYGQTNSIHVEKFNSSYALALSSRINEENYTTYIYYYDGYLRELLVSEESIYTPDSGQIISQIKDFSAEEISKGLIKITIKDSMDDVTSFFISSRMSYQEDQI